MSAEEDDQPLDWDVIEYGGGRQGWGGWTPERRAEPVPAAGNYEGVGDDPS